MGQIIEGFERRLDERRRGDRRRIFERRLYVKNSDRLENFIPNLGRLLKIRGMTKSQLAGRAKIHRSTITLLFQRKQRPSCEQFLRIADALDVPVEVLLFSLHDRADEEVDEILSLMRYIFKFPPEEQMKMLQFGTAGYKAYCDIIGEPAHVRLGVSKI